MNGLVLYSRIKFYEEKSFGVFCAKKKQNRFYMKVTIRVFQVVVSFAKKNMGVISS